MLDIQIFILIIIGLIFLFSIPVFIKFGKDHKSEIQYLPDDYFEYDEVEYLEEEENE